MKVSAISLLALLAALFLLKVVLADERSKETFQGSASVDVYSNSQCGEGAGGAKCKSGECCSIWGWCGTTSAFCEPETCQSQCVTPSPPPPPPPSSSQRCGWQADFTDCIKIGECCSNLGWCGSSLAYCAPWNCQRQCEYPLTSSLKNRMRGIGSLFY